MESYQFIHFECYSRKVSQHSSNRKQWSIKQIIDEASRRDAKSCKHVENVKKPIQLFGSIEDVEKLCDDYANSIKDKSGRKMRADAPVCLAGVISAFDDKNGWNEYKYDCIKWLQKQWGDRLRCVVEHTDEPHPHIHFYIIPHAGEKLASIHPGKAAAEAAASKKMLKGKQNDAYKQAMSAFQQRFYSDLSIKYGLTKDGPKRARLSRKAWKTQKRQAQQIAELTQKTEELQKDLNEEIGAKFLEKQTLKKKYREEIDRLNKKLVKDRETYQAALEQTIEEFTQRTHQNSPKTAKNSENKQNPNNPTPTP